MTLNELKEKPLPVTLKARVTTTRDLDSEVCFCRCRQWLQSERRPANFSEVVEELFRVIPDEVLYADAGPKRCRTCAVVGNSGNLKGAQYGALIDSFDFVVRSVDTSARCVFSGHAFLTQ